MQTNRKQFQWILQILNILFNLIQSRRQHKKRELETKRKLVKDKMLDTADFAKKVAIKQIKNEIQKTDALVKKTTNNSTLESKIIYILKVKYQHTDDETKKVHLKSY